MKLKDKIKSALEQLDLPGLKVEIEPDNGHKVIAIVTASQFESMDEGERQHLVWRKLLDELDPYEQTLVEFVHTMAPSER
jgi:acid stress-induced BolA-like protein IbaG/YrbA